MEVSATVASSFALNGSALSSVMHVYRRRLPRLDVYGERGRGIWSQIKAPMSTLSVHPVREVQTMISQIIAPIAGTLLCYLLFHVSQVLYRNLTSPLRHVVGPKNPSLVFGNFKDIGVSVRYLQLLFALRTGIHGG
jgi:hypothetical protein